MRFLFALLATFCFLSAYGQQSINCKILDAFLEDDNAKGVFGFEVYKGVPITIVDISRQFKECSVPDRYGRKVEIVHDSSYQEVVNSSNIIVYNVTRTHKRYKMKVYFKIRQAFGDIYFKKKKDYFVVSKFSVGNF